jgi:hypothetical protein
MDFKDKIEELSLRVNRLKDTINTEEATKTACVMPLIQALGYDVFNPSEVIPEYIADTPGKKGEKVDYAIRKNDEIIILMECKPIGAPLELKYASQLYRYFNSIHEARFGILTDGILYYFYSDLKKDNVMDEVPFFTFNLLENSNSKKSKAIEELKKFSKSAFDLETIIGAASNLKASRAIKNELAKIFDNPPDELIRIFAKNIYEGRLTQSVMDRFRDQTKKALYEFIMEKVDLRLQTALASNKAEVENENSSDDDPTEEKSDIETTAEELQAYRIIQAIAAEIIDAERVYMRDAKSYCAILFDDNNRQPIARLFFGKSKLAFSVFDEKNGTKIEIEKVSQLYQYREEILNSIRNYL